MRLNFCEQFQNNTDRVDHRVNLIKYQVPNPDLWCHMRPCLLVSCYCNSTVATKSPFPKIKATVIHSEYGTRGDFSPEQVPRHWQCTVLLVLRGTWVWEPVSIWLLTDKEMDQLNNLHRYKFHDGDLYGLNCVVCNLLMIRKYGFLGNA